MNSNLSPQGTKLSFNNIHAGQLILQYVKYDIFSKRTLHLEQLPRKAVNENIRNKFLKKLWHCISRRALKEYICSDVRQTLEISPFKTFHSCQFSLSTQLINQILLVE